MEIILKILKQNKKNLNAWPKFLQTLIICASKEQNLEKVKVEPQSLLRI